ncbi:MAG: preprotein translocase subunit SecY [Planctomycetota bacterium]|nr:preprotein translocase subunit SecY [Planctomycetota bacterium]
MIIIAIYRLGCFIPVPGIDLAALEDLFNKLSGGTVAGSLLAIGNMFTGGAISNAAIFGLGVMPYISASIIFQVLTVVWPTLQALSKEGESGRKKIQQYVRITTVFLAFFQGMIFLVGLANSQMNLVTTNNTFSFVILGALLITGGSMLLMWLGEQIDEYGIGNGISMIIMVGIVARFAPAVVKIAMDTNWRSPAGSGDQFGIFQIVLIIAFFLAMVLATVMITRGQRRIPIQQARRTRGNRVYGGQRTYLPIGVNMVNVIPIIFAQALFIVPNALYTANQNTDPEANPILYYSTWIFKYFQFGSFGYVLIYVALIIFFSYFYAAITFKPDEVADRMKQYGNFIPGIRPGHQTEEYLEKILTHVTMFGAFCLAGIAIVPMFASMAFGIDYMIAGFFGGTGLLITVGVALDLMQKIESHLLMHNYEGFLKKGKMKGRRR